jgi:hypothetical protein
MTPELVALARRAVSCPEWRWMPGMLAQRTTHPSVQERGGPQTVPVRFAEGVQFGVGAGMGKPTELADPYVVELTPSGERLVASAHAVVDGWHRVANLLPDLTDPATFGCLLTLVREAWRDEYLCVVPVDYGTGGTDGVWWVCRLGADGRELHRTTRKTAVEALVVALENAPTPKALG